MAKLYFGAVARRIEIELTSARPDGTWTWRAAGALNPRGALDGNLLYDGAKAGDVVRAEAEFGIEGITVISVEPPRPPESEDPNRIKLLGTPVVASVTTQLASRGRGERPNGERDTRRPSATGENAGHGPPAVPTGPRGDGTARGPRLALRTERGKAGGGRGGGRRGFGQRPLPARLGGDG